MIGMKLSKLPTKGEVPRVRTYVSSFVELPYRSLGGHNGVRYGLKI